MVRRLEGRVRVDEAPEGALTYVRRSDRGELRAPVYHEDGTATLTGIAAREGILEYVLADGSIHREFVPASTLEAAAQELAGATVTLKHPNTPDRLVSDSNRHEYRVGDVLTPVTVSDDGATMVNFHLTDPAAVAALKAGVDELSPGYIAGVDFTPGVNQYGRFDSTQKVRRYNHLAMVENGRGDNVTIRTDGAEEGDGSAVVRTLFRLDSDDENEAWSYSMKINPILLTQLLAVLGRTDATFETGDQGLQMARDTADKWAAQSQARVDSEAAKLTDAATEIESLKQQLAAEKTRADDAEARVTVLETAEQARADAADREVLAGLARDRNIDITKVEDLDEVRRLLVTHEYGDSVRADSSVEVIRALVGPMVAGRSGGEGRKSGASAWKPRPSPEPGGEARVDGADRRPVARYNGGSASAQRNAAARASRLKGNS